MTQPHYIDRACQKCGGEIQGWTCQGCGQVFRENDTGALVFAPMEAVAWRGAVADAVNGWVWSGDQGLGPRVMQGCDFGLLTDAILQALAQPAPAPQGERTRTLRFDLPRLDPETLTVKPPKDGKHTSSIAAWNRRPAPMEAVAWREKVAAIILAEEQAVADIAADYIAEHAAMHIAERIQALAVIPTEGGEGCQTEGKG